MLQPNPDFRLDPRRGVFLTGIIDESLLAKLTPGILELQAESREPISLFIDSPGGSVEIAARLRALLQAPGQGGEPPCRIITAVTGIAASAAADTLAFGDYAIAYPGATIHFHGTRYHDVPEVTAQDASQLSQMLRRKNESFAAELSRRSGHRFDLRHLWLHSEFDSVRMTKPDSTDLDCLVDLLHARLSAVGREVLLSAVWRNQRYEMLGKRLMRSRRYAKLAAANDPLAWEIEILRIVVETYLKEAARRRVSPGGNLGAVADDFHLFLTTVGAEAGQRIFAHAQRWHELYLALGVFEDPATVRAARMHPVWMLFAAICAALQDGEFALTAHDAYWLGLVDEVMGSGDLCYRILAEAAPQQPKDLRR